MSAFTFDELINQATASRTGRGSDRVLSCQGVEQPIGVWAEKLAAKLDKRDKEGNLNVRAVMIALNTAARLQKPAFGLGAFSLVSGKPYAEPKPRGPRKAKDGKPNLKPVKKTG